MLKLYNGIWFKRYVLCSVHTNFERPESIFYHAVPAPKLTVLRLIGLGLENLELERRDKKCLHGAQDWCAIAFTF